MSQIEMIMVAAVGALFCTGLLILQFWVTGVFKRAKEESERRWAKEDEKEG